MKKIYFYVNLCLLFFAAFANADLVDHLKKASGKTGVHKMRNIDFIYMINLDERPEKFAMATKDLQQYGVTPYRFSAVNGWKLSTQAINDIGLKYQPGMTQLMATTYLEEAEGLPSHEYMSKVGRTYFCHCTPKGAIGCCLSHISILQDAYDSGYETIWVMEDDIEVVRNPHILSDLIDRLDALVGKGKWDVLFTDPDYRGPDGKPQPAYGAAKRPDLDCSPKERASEKYCVQKDISQDFKKMGARFGTCSMIIRRSGIIKLLEYAKKHKVYLPYDLDNYLAPGLNRYAVRYEIVTNMLHSLSDIGSAFYEKK